MLIRCGSVSRRRMLLTTVVMVWFCFTPPDAVVNSQLVFTMASAQHWIVRRIWYIRKSSAFCYIECVAMPRRLHEQSSCTR